MGLKTKHWLDQCKARAGQAGLATGWEWPTQGWRDAQGPQGRPPPAPCHVAPQSLTSDTRSAPGGGGSARSCATAAKYFRPRPAPGDDVTAPRGSRDGGVRRLPLPPPRAPPGGFLRGARSCADTRPSDAQDRAPRATAQPREDTLPWTLCLCKSPWEHA